LNLAINRKEIIDAVYQGFASPSKIVPSEYNPAKANQILDKIGLNKRDSDGWRLRPDGKRLELLIETYAPATDFEPMCQLITENWKAVGIYTAWKYVDNSLLQSRVRANDTQILITAWEDFPVMEGNPTMINRVALNDPLKISVGFYDWYVSGGKRGIEPPEDLRKIFDLYDKMCSSSNFTQIKLYFEQWKKTVHDTLFWIVPVEDIAIPLIVSDKLGNVPDKGYQIIANFSGEVFFYK
jgi:peptide/nickel transport system substrate-binding protein